ncbi:protein CHLORORESPIRATORY REDUCTION 7, chloroplastic isoform X2 [Vitis riparia]|uniref:protein CHLORORESPIRATORY REDUCTION 7, chloroplastic isoform X2 n=1 Tax=Vitis riparia TaxID=96939 RepID=UPI00155A1DEB|nr:protein CHLORORESPIRATORY REDUCTION 7, chloroplastic isoform X2 [Vitis riparia]
MLKLEGSMVAVEGALGKQLFGNGVQNFSSKLASKPQIQVPRPETITVYQTSFYLRVPKISTQHRDAVKTYAMRRRRAYSQTETYVLMEPGKDEEFVSQEELKARLKGWLENWPGKALPPDLAKFQTIDDAVMYLVKAVCELEIDGDVGSIQWYEVRLE